MSICVAVIGAGRMGSVVAAKVPGDTKKLIYDMDTKKAEELAKQVSGECIRSISELGAADIVMIVLPAQAVNDMIEHLLGVVDEGTIIMNMATSARVDSNLLQSAKNIDIYNAKIIGHAASILKGEPGIIVVDCYESEKFALIKTQLAGFYRIEQGDPSLVEKINTMSSNEGIKAAVSLRRELRKMEIPEEWLNVAIRTVCAGTMKSFTENDLGHFAQELVKKLEQDE